MDLSNKHIFDIAICEDNNKKNTLEVVYRDYNAENDSILTRYHYAGDRYTRIYINLIGINDEKRTVFISYIRLDFDMDRYKLTGGEGINTCAIARKRVNIPFENVFVGEWNEDKREYDFDKAVDIGYDFNRLRMIDTIQNNQAG